MKKYLFLLAFAFLFLGCISSNDEMFNLKGKHISSHEVFSTELNSTICVNEYGVMVTNLQDSDLICESKLSKQIYLSEYDSKKLDYFYTVSNIGGYYQKFIAYTPGSCDKKDLTVYVTCQSKDKFFFDQDMPEIVDGNILEETFEVNNVYLVSDHITYIHSIIYEINELKTELTGVESNTYINYDVDGCLFLL